jgi:hypothetical protein
VMSDDERIGDIQWELSRWEAETTKHQMEDAHNVLDLLEVPRAFGDGALTVYGRINWLREQGRLFQLAVQVNRLQGALDDARARADRAERGGARLREALRLAAIRLEILTGRMRACHEETGNHELIEEAEMFVEEAKAASSSVAALDGTETPNAP